MWERVFSSSKKRYYWRCGSRSQWKRPSATDLVFESYNDENPTIRLPIEVVKAALGYCDAASCGRLCAANRKSFVVGSDRCVWQCRTTGDPSPHSFGIEVSKRIEMRADRAGRSLYRQRALSLLDPQVRDTLTRDLFLEGLIKIPPKPCHRQEFYTSSARAAYPGLLDSTKIDILDKLGPKGFRISFFRTYPRESIEFALERASSLDNRRELEACLDNSPRDFLLLANATPRAFKQFLQMTRHQRCAYLGSARRKATFDRMSTIQSERGFFSSTAAAAWER